MRATTVVPVKRFAVAKSRLAPGIEDARRPELAAAMVADVLEAIGAVRSVERTIVVSREPMAAELAAAAGAELLADFEDASHSAAALAGIAAAEAAGARCVALLPGDCPLLDPRELDRVLTGLPDPYVTVVPDRHGSGTNALVLAPPGAIEPSFGEGSCERHVAAARAAGIPYGVEELPSLGLDLDTPADLVALTMAVDKTGGARRTAKALGI
ncbi:MAG TPA: 2-phospho-L-lactate guanylyltransferase [Solirubrobacterales bacterium]|nr:2-phospho-L-lactate guanylyltransferase [Solirubrobacterales bacterium]